MNKEELKKEILKNKGITITEECKKASVKSGYFVSLNGYEFITYNIDEAIKKSVEYKEVIKNKKDYYIGFWIDEEDNNKIYVDISKHYFKSRDAVAFGKKNCQKAIYNIKDNKTIYLDYNITFYTLYKKIFKEVNNKKILIDYKFIKQYDNKKSINNLNWYLKNDYILFKDIININEL